MKLVALLLLVVAACSSSGDDDDAATETKPADTAPPSTEPASTVSATVDTSSPATSAPSAASDVAADLSGALGLAIGTGNFVEPEPECFDDAYAALPVSARRTVLAVEEDPLSWPASVDRDGANEVLSAYLGCVEPERLRQWLVLSVLQVLDEQECVSAAWEDLVTPDAVASSVAYGDGLDDLDPALVEQLTATAAACVPDRQWWIDDVAIDLEGDDLTADEASCVAIAYVDVLGVNEVIRRRILTIPLLAVPSADEERLDLQRRCGVSPVVQLAQLDAPVGTCLTGFGSGADSTEVIDCAAAHNAEVVAVHDLGAEYATWPGMQMLRDKTTTQCPADVEALPVDAVDYIAGWDMPDRASWEQAARTLTCTLVRPGFASWTGPSDVALPAPTTTAPANVGQEVLDIDTLAVGQCLQPTGRLARPDGRGTTAVHLQVRQPAPRGGVPRLRARRGRHSVSQAMTPSRLAPTRAASTPSARTSGCRTTSRASSTRTTGPTRWCGTPGAGSCSACCTTRISMRYSPRRWPAAASSSPADRPGFRTPRSCGRGRGCGARGGRARHGRAPPSRGRGPLGSARRRHRGG